MRDRDRDEFLTLRARLHAVAQKHGDATFAAALRDCIVDASGGEPWCPMAEFFLEEYARTGHLPDMDDPRPRPLRPLIAPEASYDRGRLLAYVHRALEERAILRKDTRYLEGLQGCERAMRESAHCPMHRLFETQPPHAPSR